MSLGVVRALVVAGPRPTLTAAVSEAVGVQTRPVASVAVEPAEGVNRAAPAAFVDGADWLWLVDGATVPRTDALEAFEAVHDAVAELPEPLLLAGRVLDENGALHPDAAPRHEIFEKDLTVAAIERGLVQVRAVPAGSVLLRRAAFERFGPLRADLPPRWAVFDFTARALREHPDTGYLAPESIAVRRLPPHDAGGALRTRARLLTGPTWTTTERLWEGFLVAEGVLRAARGRGRRA